MIRRRRRAGRGTAVLAKRYGIGNGGGGGGVKTEQMVLPSYSHPLMHGQTPRTWW